MKAKEVTIQLGAISLKAYQMPNGEHKLSIESVCSSISKPRNSMLQISRGKSAHAERLAEMLDGAETVFVENSTARIKTIPLEGAAFFWDYWGSKNNAAAKALQIACTAEAIARRIDAAVSVKKTESEYNSEFEERRQFWEREYKAAIVQWTDCFETEVLTVELNPSFSPKEKKEEFAAMRREFERGLEARRADYEPMIALYS